MLRRLLGGWRRSPVPPVPGAVGAAGGDYDARKRRELEIYADQAYVHELPPIFHYWSNKYLRPRFEAHGFAHPEDFYRVRVGREIRSAAGPLRAVSLGAGNGDLEIRLARALRDEGLEAFRLTCVDINPDMLARGRAGAEAAGVADLVDFEEGDFNAWAPDRPYDLVLVNQALHHVVNLEGLLDGIRRAIEPDGLFLTCDMIGRNGHQRWPEARRWVEHYWRELPESYRYNHQLRRPVPEFEDWDCAQESFEGIRAQDILPLLLERFGFELFIAFGGFLDVFLDRAYGHSFDADGAWDRDFVDRLTAHQDELLLAGEITPTQMVAALRPYAIPEPRVWSGLTPERAVRPPGKGSDRAPDES